MGDLFKGVWPALVTPFTADNQVNVAVLRDLVSYHIGKQVDGFYVSGTTGEGIFMTVPERKLVIETVLAEVAGRVPIIVHVGSTALEDARDLALFCAHNGAAGISSIVPPYYDNVPALVGYFTSLARSVPDLPVLPYFLTQSIKPLDLVKHVLDVPNIVGTKYTGPDMNEFRQIIEVSGGRWTVFAGMDEMCMFALMAGADGNIGSTLNFMPGVYREIQACVSRGDLAQAQVYQMKANRVINVLLQDNLMGALKATVGLIGFDCGQPRLPRQPLTAEQQDRLVSQLQETDFEELVRL